MLWNTNARGDTGGFLRRFRDHRVLKACDKGISVLWKTHSLILQLLAPAYAGTNKFLEGLDSCLTPLKPER